ncbi:MAG: PEPxxWA-CTERM sorting domain-containing protein [Phenylobacterium sp.]|uniref:PEPxxWA-CTERM sorting domain-containing protein n=1 Tax=Phenylobacterium sp. TaxID=1871053 RepID=UPI001A3D7E0C|nr:PEPxxWA-CTERM sorting domain-containing protein [Phenylobacterium sp.]MBL8555572.1 PEPxxWA-CTERM sorting domain-containing protein [Phenylobacterium sp.]
MIAVGGAGAAQALDIASSAQGWANDTGAPQFFAYTNGAADGNNTFTGNEFGGRFNSWAAFDIPVGVYTTVQLELALNFYGDVIGDQIGVYDVSTAYAVFENGTTSDDSTYIDLGSGSNYGNFFALNGNIFTITLGGNALADVNSAAGGKFLIGFTNLTKNATPSGDLQDDGVYTNGSSVGSPVLRLDGAAAVPEPGAWALMILGFGAAGSMLRARRRAAATA